DSGATWSEMEIPTPQYANGREAFVRVARSVTNDESKFDIYFGDSIDLYRKTVSNSSPATSGSWKTLSLDHSDPSDIAFDTEQRMPILLASDGGVHVTTDKGASWKLAGGGYGGFTALQITEVTGQEVSGSSPHLD